jgi:hypothetical protein
VAVVHQKSLAQNPHPVVQKQFRLLYVGETYHGSHQPLSAKLQHGALVMATRLDSTV